MDAAPPDASGLSLDFKLGQAVQSGDIHKLNEILAQDPAAVMKMMAKNPGKMNLVHKAAARGHADVLRRLLEVGGRHDVELPNGDRAIHLAVRSGRAAALKTLLDRGADYTAKNKAGHSALSESVRGRQPHCFLHLVQSGADYYTLISQGKLTGHDITQLKRDFSGMPADQQLLLKGTLEHVAADFDVADSRVKSQADLHREQFKREQEHQVMELQVSQLLSARPSDRIETRGPTRTDPYDVCSAVIAESKSARSELRKSLEVRCQVRSDIMEEAAALKHAKVVDAAKAKAKLQVAADGVGGVRETRLHACAHAFPEMLFSAADGCFCPFHFIPGIRCACERSPPGKA